MSVTPISSRVGWIVAALAVAIGAAGAQAADPENCLSCHRYKGMATIDPQTQRLRLFYIDPSFHEFQLGPHARLRCTDCHDRSAVGVIPHQQVPPVNCTTACHLTSPTQLEITFSHESAHELLAASTHTPEVLDKCNRLFGEPLKPGQANCLLCHQDATFSDKGFDWLHQEQFIGRCNSCHGEEVPVDTNYFYHHVVSRSRPALSGPNTVRQCALCHSDERVMREFGLINATASYLQSFHGKAMQLGSTETAVCLECHVGPAQNPHLILGPEKAASPVSEANLPTTCRSPQCHPSAGHRVSSAAVHLDLAGGGGIEFIIGCVFFVLILTTFGPSVLLQSLEMLQIVLGHHDPEHHEHVRRAKALMRTAEGREALVRFTLHQRVQHWLLVICFTILVLTGFPIKFADRNWAEWLINTFGGLSVARFLHHWVGVILIAGGAYHMLYVAIYAIRQKRRTGLSWFMVVYNLPMTVNLNDIKALIQQLKFLLWRSDQRPEGPRFSLKEKFEYFGVFWGSALLGLTGLLMWANSWTSQYLPGRTLTIANLLHTFEAYLALLHVGIIHMIGVFFAPGVFPMSRAMFNGDTPIEEMAEVHSGMIAEAEQKIGAGRRKEASDV